MRILQIAGTFVGAQREIEYGIHEYLKKQGHESYILYTIGDIVDDPCIIRHENRVENAIRRLLRKYIGKNPHFSLLGTLKILRYAKKIKPDVVHLHVLHHGYIDYVVLFKGLSKMDVPAVYTMHDLWAATGGCYYYSSVGCDRFKQGCSDCPLSLANLDCSPKKTGEYLEQKQDLYRSIKKLCFVSVSPWVHEELTRGPMAEYALYTVLNSAYIPETTRSAGGLRLEKFTIIGVAANWDERKGVYRFLELAKLLGDRYQISLVGDVKDEIRKIAPSNISFIGTVTDRQRLFGLYAQADLHVSMSYEETFGMTFIEAAFVGTKAMGFKSTAIPGVLEKTFGYVVDQLDVVAMAVRIKKLYERRDECALDDQQILAVKSFFSPERMAAEYLEIYKQMKE